MIPKNAGTFQNARVEDENVVQEESSKMKWSGNERRGDWRGGAVRSTGGVLLCAAHPSPKSLPASVHQGSPEEPPDLPRLPPPPLNVPRSPLLISTGLHCLLHQAAGIYVGICVATLSSCAPFGSFQERHIT